MRHRENERTLSTKMDEKGRTHREQVWKKSQSVRNNTSRELKEESATREWFENRLIQYELWIDVK